MVLYFTFQALITPDGFNLKSSGVLIIRFHPSFKIFKMTIKVLVATFKKEVYQQVTAFYNQNKPAGWKNLIEGRFAEGGFEIELEDDYVNSQRAKGRSNPNDLFRQVRWSQGRLESFYYIPFTEEQTELLYRALQHGFGADKVVLI